VFRDCLYIYTYIDKFHVKYVFSPHLDSRYSFWPWVWVTGRSFYSTVPVPYKYIYNCIFCNCFMHSNVTKKNVRKLLLKKYWNKSLQYFATGWKKVVETNLESVNSWSTITEQSRQALLYFCWLFASAAPLKPTCSYNAYHAGFSQQGTAGWWDARFEPGTEDWAWCAIPLSHHYPICIPVHTCMYSTGTEQIHI